MRKIVQFKKVEINDANMRLDRWFKIRYPNLNFGTLQKFLRSGQVRLDGRRIKPDARICFGQIIRIPPSFLNAENSKIMDHPHNVGILSQMLLYEDSEVFVFNKPPGLAVQGGSSISEHIDGMLEAWRNKKGERPRLVHRIDRDTSGILVVARTRSAAQALSASFRTRSVKKQYWALVYGTPRKKEGKIYTSLIKETNSHGGHMRICKHDRHGAIQSISYYRTIDAVDRSIAWLEMEPCTGRTHQLRIHAAHIGHPIIGDKKYFCPDKNRNLPAGIQNRLHLHAYRICISNPSGGTLDITAPLPPHMAQSFNFFSFKYQ